MSRQIAVRLPDDVVAFLDEAVTTGAARSRAEIVQRALHRERRRMLAARDAEVLAAARGVEDDDLAGLADHAVSVPLELD